MKWLKKGSLLLLVLNMFVGLWGCKTETPMPSSVPETPVPTTDPVVAAYKKDPGSFVEFSRSTEPRVQYVPIEELMQYESKYPDCNGTWYRDQLSGEDVLIYNSFLYALENRFIHFYVYVEDSDKDFSYIREYVSLDSPFLEQNYSHYEHIWKVPINYIGKSISVSMEQFTDSRWEMKLEALEKCRQIVRGIPAQCQTQQEKMEYLYDYVCDNVEYVAYEKMADESYFYDAVCKGETVCDGYSNMLSLLFRLIGVECCEAVGYNEQSEMGHTWVVAKLDGQFYNFDPTFEDTGETSSEQRRYFGFSDDLAGVKVLNYEEIRPKCTDTSRDFLYADLIVSSITKKSEVKKIAELTKQRLSEGSETSLIGIKGPVDSKTYDRFYDRYFGYAKKIESISVRTFPMRDAALLEITVTPK